VVVQIGSVHQGVRGRTDWAELGDGWAPDDYIVEFWAWAVARTTAKWSGAARRSHMTDIDELCATAAEALIKFSRAFPVWCEEHDVPPTVPLFASILGQAIDGGISDFLKSSRARVMTSTEALEGAADEEPDEDWIRTGLSRYRPPSLLHGQLVDFIESMTPKDQTVLALLYFDGLKQSEVAPLFGVSQVTIANYARRATSRILSHSKSLVVEDPAPRPRSTHDEDYAYSPELCAWTADRYGTDPDTYLKYIAINYRADVSYILDFLDHGNGIIRTQRGRGAATLKRAAA
jgi:RNA polymerase sigma factor (sigma-70 family)